MVNSAAVIFDVDGVLVDSYAAHLESWQRIAREDGVKFDERDFLAGFGRTSREIIQMHWPGMTGAGADDPRIRAIDDRKEALYREIVAGDFPAMHGAAALIDALTSAGFALAMGSSGPPENLEVALDGLDRRRSFQAVVSGRDVRRGKPEPDIFLLAAKRLDVAASRCVVIEDAPAGVQAARAAGMACVALLSRGRERSHFDHCSPDRMVMRLSEITPKVIAALV